MWHVLTSHLLFNVLHIDSTLGKRGDFHQKVVYLQFNPKHVFLFTRFSTVLIKRDHKSEIGQSKIINSQRIKWKYFPRLSLLQWWKRGVFKKFVVTWNSRMTIWQPRYHACQQTSLSASKHHHHHQGLVAKAWQPNAKEVCQTSQNYSTPSSKKQTQVSFYKPIFRFRQITSRSG